MQTLSDPYKDGILHLFPDAIEHKDFIAKVGRYLYDELHIPHDEDVLAGNSICSDDLNQIQFPNLGNDLGGPFNLGGLAGGAFTGITGLNAFLHHIPDKSKHVVIFYGPHIGASFNGSAVTVGTVKRLGQEKPSTCCGALVAALSRINGMREPVVPGDNDFQFDIITNVLFYEKETLDRIPDMQGKIMKATSINYTFIENKIAAYLKETHLPPDLTVILIGGIIINVDDPSSLTAFFDKKKMTTWQHSPAGSVETDFTEKYTQWMKKL